MLQHGALTGLGGSASTARVNEVVPASPALGVLLSRLSDGLERASQKAVRSALALDRLCGPVPSSIGPAGMSSSSDNVLDALEGLLGRLHALEDGLGSIADRLDAVV